MMNNTIRPRIACMKDYFNALQKLPRGIQKKAAAFLDKFERDPKSASINYEKLRGSVHPKVRSVRIDLAYRALVLEPDDPEDLYILLWIDHHDEAYRWVENKRFEPHPVTGALQCYEIIEPEQIEAPARPDASHHDAWRGEGLFDAVSDEELMHCGLPALLIPAVRGLEFEAQLDALAPHLPAEAADALCGIAAGMSVEEAIAEVERASRPDPRVDATRPIAASLAAPAARQRFALLEDDEELAAQLERPLEHWRLFLHPTQRELAHAQTSGPFRVLGGAGTGKTVVLLHRARYLARDTFSADEDRILVTTYTRNLAADLARQLDALCGEERERIEVANLHSWAYGFLRRIDQGAPTIPARERPALWKQAWEEADASRPLAFYQAEWDEVALPQGIETRRDYFFARRAGRGTGLDRAARAEVWRVLSRYRALLEERGQIEWDDVLHRARRALERDPELVPYRAVLVDESQDMNEAQLRLLRALAPDEPDSLFLVGDGNQRIYAARPSLASCGIEIRGRSRRLKLNYRTTDQIGRWAAALLGEVPGELGERPDALDGYRASRRGAEPSVRYYDSERDALTGVAAAISSLILDELVEPHEICVAARTRALVASYAEAIAEAGIPHHILSARDEQAEPGAVRLATMHRVKGLEFRAVLLAGVNQETAPLALDPDRFADQSAYEDFQRSERCLLYVAATRARDYLQVHGPRPASPWIALPSADQAAATS